MLQLRVFCPSKMAMQELQDRIEKLKESFEPSDAEYMTEMEQIWKDIVNFHGEMVLLLNYSSVNYTGCAFFWLPFTLSFYLFIHFLYIYFEFLQSEL